MIINIINSEVGKTGTIGQRTGYILDHLKKNKNVNHLTICRGSVQKYKKDVKVQGYTKFVPRLLNLYRIYFKNKFQYRNLDIKLFDKHCLNILKKTFNKDSSKNRIAHFWEPCLQSIYFAKKNKYKIILDVPIAPTLHSKNLDEQGLWGVNDIDFEFLIEQEKKCFNLVDKFIVPSEFVSSVLQKYAIPRKKVHVVNFGVDHSQFSFERKYRNENKIRFCFAGAINTRKGIKYLLDAFNDPVFQNDELHLCGRLFDDEKQLIKKTNLKNIFLPGIISTSSYFRKCDVYVFPSLMEGSSKSVFEAMASAMPVITTPNAGSVIRNDLDGFIIPPANSIELKERMVRLKDDYILRKEMGESAKKFSMNFTWDAYAKKVKSVYGIKNS